uniref:Selenoprotein F/M domain-containing protein n=1 Tax=Ditylum brightwellii TaxID=49249 RepID=A0A6U3TIQ2_9STRA
MKISIAFLAAIIPSVAAFAPVATPAFARTQALNGVPLANGSMEFDRVCREWRCKYEGDKVTSESLESIAKVLEEYLPTIKGVSEGITVNRLICGGCLDFKLQMTVPLDDFGPWEEKGFEPEAEFLEKIKAIEGVSQVETQTITNMII